MLSYLGLAQAGLWAVKVNDGAKTVIVVKLGTDGLKWIQRGVPINLLIGHVEVENALIRVIGLEVFDCKTHCFRTFYRSRSGKLRIVIYFLRSTGFHSTLITGGLSCPSSTPPAHFLRKLFGLIFHNRSKSGTLYEPIGQRLLPLDTSVAGRFGQSPLADKELARGHGRRHRDPPGSHPRIPFYLVFRASAESLASENASRLAATERADKEH